MTLINVKTGKANTQNALSELYAFYTPRPAVEGNNGIETFIGKAARDMRHMPTPPIREHGRAIVIPSIGNIPPDIGGQMASATYEVVDGTIIKLMAKRRVGGWNQVMQIACTFLQFRDGAAYRHLKFYPVRDNALSMDFLGVEGRFDVITLEQAEALGAELNPMTRKMAQLHDESMFDIITLAEEETPAATMVPVEGSERMRPVIKRKRRIEKP
jgi:hypothetical protein